MSGPPVQCVVYVDGERFADTGADYAAGAPTILEGLSTTWGRETITDQPAVSSCSFVVRDAGADADYLDLLHVGSSVLVDAVATDPHPLPYDIAVDGSFEANTPHNRLGFYDTPGTFNAAHVISTDPAGRTGRAYKIRATSNIYDSANSRYTAPVLIPPAPWSASIRGWDGLPVSSPGSTWTVRLRFQPVIATAIVAAVRLTPLVFNSPRWPPSYGPQGATVTITRPGTGWVAGAWYTLEASVVVDAAPPTNRWVGAQVDAPAYTWALPAGGTWTQWTETWATAWPDYRVDDFEVIAPPAPTKTVPVFAGRVTDLSAAAAGDTVECAVTASGYVAELANDVIGMAPETAPITVWNRLGHVQAAAATYFGYQADTRIQNSKMAPLDIDAQPVLEVLTDMAVSADAVLWALWTQTRGLYVWFEDPMTRDTLATFALVGGVVVITNPLRPTGVVLDACDVLRDPLELEQTVADVLTVIDLTYQTVGAPDPETGAPTLTETHVVTRDAAAVDTWGQRRASITTQLTTLVEAQDMAARMLERSRRLGWHTSGLTWDTAAPMDATHLRAVLQLLSYESRSGCGLTLTDPPAWIPAPGALSMYVDGGTYRYADARWVLELRTTPGAGTGQSVTWSGLTGTWKWNQFDPAIAWLDCWGVTAGSLSDRRN